MPGTETQFYINQSQWHPLKYSLPLPTYRIGAVLSAGGTRKVKNVTG